MSKKLSKFNFTNVQELIDSVKQRSIESVVIASGGSAYAVGDVAQTAGGTVLKVTNLGANNSVATMNVVSTMQYSNLVAFSNTSTYNCANGVAASFGGQDPSGTGLRISVALDTNAVLTNNIYAVVSGITDNSGQFETSSEKETFLDLWNEVIFGKKVSIYPVIRRVNWSTGSVYHAYDDAEADLESKNFYVINSFGEVFKCLDNGATPEQRLVNQLPVSTVEPVGIGPAPGFPMSLGDGYTWVKMTEIPSEVLANIATPAWLPLVKSSAIENSLVSLAKNALNSIRVEASGSGYPSYTGSIDTISYSTNELTVNGAIPNPEYYINSGLTVANTSGHIENKKISDVVINNNAGVYSTTFKLASGQNFHAGIGIGTTFVVSPYVEITSATGQYATAYSEVEKLPGETFGKIARINMLNYGEGYFDSTVTVISSVGSGATARGIISPGKGHCFDLYNELFTKTVMFYALFDQADYPKDAKYSTIALLRNPLGYDGSKFISNSFNQSLKIPLNSNSSSFVDGEVISCRTSVSVANSEIGSGRLVSANSSLAVLTDVKGIFNPNAFIVSPTTGQFTATANTSTWTTAGASIPLNSNSVSLKKYTGETLYINNTNELISRNSSQSEQIKVIITL